MRKNVIRNRLTALLICLLFIFSNGCASVPVKSIEDSLVIYCMESIGLEVKYYTDKFLDYYPETIFEVRTFSDAQEMDEILVQELNVGIGPDIVIFNDETELDVLRMAKNGAFIPLDEMLKADAAFHPEDYFSSAIDVGRTDGRQYLLPLTFTIPFVMYDAGSELGFAPAPVISHSDFMQSVIAGLEDSQDERNAGALYVRNETGYRVTNDLVSPMLFTSQILRLSEKNKVENFSEESLKQVADWLKIYINQCAKKSKDITDALGTNAWTIAENIKYFYSYTSYDIVRSVWLYNSVYGYAGIEQFGVSAFHEIGSDNVVAVLKSYGVIGNTAHPLAYEFLRMAMDTFLSPYAANFASSTKISNIDMMFAMCTWGTRFRRMQDGSVFAERPLDDELMEHIRQIFSSVNHIIIPNAKLDSIFRDSFTAYFSNEKPYDDCANNFIQKLDLYLSE